MPGAMADFVADVAAELFKHQPQTLYLHNRGKLEAVESGGEEPNAGARELVRKGAKRAKGPKETRNRSRAVVQSDEPFSFGDLPASYADAYTLILEKSQQFRAQVASVLAPRLNAHLKTLPQDNYADKQALATWVNNELRQLGLAIRCPKTGKPATLVADSRGQGEYARFRLDVRGDDGRHLRTMTSTTLPEFELIEDEPRREGRAGLRSR